MKKQEPRKHHYIPRFILKNFNDNNGQVNYWDIKKNKLEKRNIKSVFMNIDMYRDETINEQDPTQIESKFAIFECEIAKLINSKIKYINNSSLIKKWKLNVTKNINEIEIKIKKSYDLKEVNKYNSRYKFIIISIIIFLLKYYLKSK